MQRTLSLLSLTVATGIIDAVSFLALGNVFTALMTGNVAFLGFALAGVEGFSAVKSASALLAFMGGAWAVGRIGQILPRYVVWGAAVIELVALATAALVAKPSIVIPLLGAAMGAQTAVMLKLKEPVLKTNVLTLTLAGLAAHGLAPGGRRIALQMTSVTALFVGAGLGALTLNESGLRAALGFAVLGVGLGFAMLLRSSPHTS